MHPSETSVTVTQWRDLLRSGALRIASDSSTFPVNVGKLCSELGVGLQHRDDIPRFSALLTDGGKDWDSATICLPSTGYGTHYERFCIAHEIGHLLIYREFGTPPQDKGSYWQLEELCDEFARMLLAPDNVVEHYLSDREPTGALNGAFSLSRAAKIPWIQAAKRISEQQPFAKFLRLHMQDSRTKIVASTYPNQRERGRLLDSENRFCNLLWELQSYLQPWEFYYVESAQLSEADIPSLSEALEGAISIRTHRSYADAYLATVE